MSRTPEITYKIMSAIKSKNTKPELVLRHALWKKGLRYRVNVNWLPGKPDIVFTRAKIAVFCDGDFWHGHNWALRGISSLKKELKNYSPFWREKILGNIKRDKKNNKLLKNDNWLVIRIWESDINKNVDKWSSIVEKHYKKIITRFHYKK